MSGPETRWNVSMEHPGTGRYLERALASGARLTVVPPTSPLRSPPRAMNWWLETALFVLFHKIYMFFYVLFRVTSAVFFHSFEIVCQDNVPRGDGPVVILPNHSNGLVDAITAVSSNPGHIRLTAKSTLWRDAYWRFWVEGVGTVPMHRAVDSGNERQDNSEAFAKLFEALNQGSCVGLFPEGLSRYHPQLSEIKIGTALLALQFLSQPDRKHESICIVPAGFNYIRRDKFRSDVLVKFNTPFWVSSDFIFSGENIKEAALRLTQIVESGIREVTMYGPDWQTIRLAHLARQMTRSVPHSEPGLVTVSLESYVQTTHDFIDALSPATAPHGHSTQVVVAALKEYETRLDTLGLSDYYLVTGSESSLLGLAARFVLYLVLAVVLLSASLPVVALVSPILYIIRSKENKVLSLGVVGHKDDVAQYKIGFASLYPIMSTIAFCAVWLFASFAAALLWVGGAVVVLWLSLRCVEEGMAAARAASYMWTVLRAPQSAVDDALRCRAALHPQLESFAKAAGVAQPELIRHSWAALFNPLHQLKRDWNDVLRIRDLKFTDDGLD